MQRVRGHSALNHDECGLLVEGFDSPPPMMLGHALPHYGWRVEEQGYAKEQDLLAYLVPPDVPPPRQLETLAKAVCRTRQGSRATARSFS